MSHRLKCNTIYIIRYKNKVLILNWEDAIPLSTLGHPTQSFLYMHYSSVLYSVMSVEFSSPFHQPCLPKQERFIDATEENFKSNIEEGIKQINMAKDSIDPYVEAYRAHITTSKYS